MSGDSVRSDSSATNGVRFDLGAEQRFRYRTPDINILGETTGALPVRRAEYVLNGANPEPFYVEPESPYRLSSPRKTPSALRLNRLGQFNIEIPADSGALRPGDNRLSVEIEDGDGIGHCNSMEFSWDPRPVPLPLVLDDLGSLGSIQDIGQIVDGAFAVDTEANSVCTVEPVPPDALLVIGSRHRSQEATYQVIFGPQSDEAVFVGVSDFFASHDAQSLDLSIKPGYTTAGLASIRPNGVAEMWIMRGELLKGHDWAWRRIGRASMEIESGVPYRVRHRVIVDVGFNWAQFKLWVAGTREPDSWLCETDSATVERAKRRVGAASFALIQFGGSPTSWSDIRVVEVEIDPTIRQAVRRRQRFVRVAILRSRAGASDVVSLGRRVGSRLRRAWRR